MDPVDLVARLSAIRHRGAGTDAERRAARLLAGELRTAGRRGIRTRTIWVRPSWALVHAGLALTAVVASVLAVSAPTTGLALAGAVLVMLLGDLSGRLPLLRRLTPARATQLVIARDPREDAVVRLVLTAATDVPRPGVLERGGAARGQAALRRRLRGHLPGPHGLLVLALLALLACLAVRASGLNGPVIGAVQLVPTAIVLLLGGAFADAALARTPAQGASADASAAAVLLALVADLAREPPQHLAVDVVLAGAGHAHAAGLRRWIRDARKEGLRAEGVAVLHLAACGAGTPAFWTRDGLVLPLRAHPRLVAIAREAASAAPGLGARAHESRGTSGARAARSAGWPALAIGALDATGTAPRAGTAADTTAQIDPEALAATRAFTLDVVRRLDRSLGAPVD